MTDSSPGPQPTRRYPSFKGFILTGAVLGLIVGAVLTYSEIGADQLATRGYSATTVMGYLGVGLGALGALLGALVALALDARRRP